MTGEALATGKPPKGKENMKMKAFGYILETDKAGPPFSYIVTSVEGRTICSGLHLPSIEACKEDANRKMGQRIFNSTSFQNGRLKAEREIGEKASK